MAPTWPQDVPTWAHLVPTCHLLAILAQLGNNLGQTWANLAPTWPNWAPTWAQLGPTSAQLGPNLAPTWPNLAPTWPQLGPNWSSSRTWCASGWKYKKPKKTNCFSMIFGDFGALEGIRRALEQASLAVLGRLGVQLGISGPFWRPSWPGRAVQSRPGAQKGQGRQPSWRL